MNQNNQQSVSQSVSQSKLDGGCYINKQINENRSIFDYVTNNMKFVNKTDCLDVTPPFLNYIPMGIPNQNIDIENELRGIVRMNSRCTNCKFHPQDLNSTNLNNMYPNNKQICQSNNMILPNGYYKQN